MSPFVVCKVANVSSATSGGYLPVGCRHAPSADAHESVRELPVRECRSRES
jgi:hypothetical protein